MIIEASFEQHSDEWNKARHFSIGSTDIARIITTTGVRSKSRDDLLFEKASYRITKKEKPFFQNHEMKWGLDYEQEARDLFSFIKGIKIDQCAMVFSDEEKNWHCSPDGYNPDLSVGLEIKCPQLKEFMNTRANGKLPTKHILQIQSSLALTGYQSWWFMSFFPNLYPFIIEVNRDETLISIIKKEIDLFHKDLYTVVLNLMSF